MKKADVPENIDSYIAEFPAEAQAKMQQMRAAIREAAPDAAETIGYAMPTFKLHGNLVHFAGYERHIGFYPGAAPLVHFARQLQGYKTSKGGIQFPLDKPLPLQLVKEITLFRVQENLAKKAKKSV